MKKIVLTLILIGGYISSFAQTSEMELLMTYFKMERKAAVAQFMQLDDSVSVAFWEVYGQYEAERQLVANDRIAAIKKYGENYFNMTPELATEAMNTALARRTAIVKLQKKYVKLFTKATNSITTLKFFQIDSYMDSIVEYQLMESMPFIGEIK